MDNRFLMFGISTRNYALDPNSVADAVHVECCKDLVRWHHSSSPLWQKIINYTLIGSSAFVWQIGWQFQGFLLNVFRFMFMGYRGFFFINCLFF